VAIVKDLSREQAQDARLRSVVESSPSALLMIDREARIVLCNAAAERLFGWPREALLGAGLGTLVPERLRASHEWLVSRYFGHPETRMMAGARELNALRRDGTEVPVEVALNLIDAPGAPHVLAVVHDITERKRVEAVRRARELAERESRSKSELLSRLGHEIRTPLNAMIGFADLLSGLPASREDPLLQRYAANIRTGGEHLEKLLGDLTMLNQGDLHRLDLRIEDVALAEEIPVAAELARSALRGGDDIVVEPNPAQFAGLRVRADALRLRQVLTNLIGNAIKYNRRGGRVSLAPDVARPGRVGIAVGDTGVGIEAADLARGFEPFERLGAENSQVEGSGLGLTIVRQLVREMQGEIDVASRPGHGSTFTVYLPAGRPAQADEATDAAAGAATIRVLYVEDNRLNIALMESILSMREGGVLRSTAIGSEALAIAAAWQPHLVMLDRGLPEMNGEQVLRALRADATTATIPVVLCSASSSAEHIARFMSLGAMDYWVKPIRVEQVLACLDALRARLARSQAPVGG
jgi:PAS domain S-box-containing protein